MGYRNDQFFNLRMLSPDDHGPATSRVVGRGANNSGRTFYPDADNPEFIYPSRVVRTMDKDGVLNSTILKRGFIRSLPVQSGYPIKKCQFQFNPQTLTHGVAMSEGVYNVFNQDPGQYAQPMGGQVNFAFTLMFDRSMEMNSDIGQAQSSNPWETGDPSQVGVLRDVATFYSVIGQGMSETQRSYIQDELEKSIELETSQINADGGEISEEEVLESIGNIPTFLENNVGNFGWLLPTPVRVVFSSLYMVEGFVLDTEVTFTKFNTAFVPMQCVLRVTMKAQYVGHARKDTFLTWSLAERQNAIDEARERERETAQASFDAALSELTQWDMAVGYASQSSVGGSDTAAGLKTPLTVSEEPVRLFVRPHDSFTRSRYNDDSAVAKLFTAGNASIKWTAKVQAYTRLPENMTDWDFTTSPNNPSGQTPVLDLVVASKTYNTSDEWFTAVDDFSRVSVVTNTAWASVGSPTAVPTSYRDASYHVDKPMLINYVIYVTITYEGTTIQGTGGWSTLDIAGSSTGEAWSDPLEQVATVHYDFTGDPDSAVDTVPTEVDVPSPRAPSNVS